MQDQKKDILRYAAFWLWLLVVSAGVWLVYTSILQTIPDLLRALLGIDQEVNSNLSDNRVVWQVLQMILFVLLWWRAVKVIVLHGSPIPIGLVMHGRENSGRSGRPVWRIYIGDIDAYSDNYEGRFWYGAVFRSHPSSDKIMRSRLEFLVLTFPAGYTLIIQESRFFIKQDDHQGRARRFRLSADRYSNTRDQTTPDRFRSEVVRQLRRVGEYFEEEKRAKRIDGLRWYSYMGGGGYIMDDFNHRLKFEYLEEEKKYKVTELGPNGDTEKVVDSINELRAVVRDDFESTWSGNKSEMARREPTHSG